MNNQNQLSNMNNEIKPGNIVRLTDPISNGEIVRIDNVDEYGYASWLGGSQNCDMEQISIEDVNSDLLYYYKTLSDIIGHIENTLKIKLYPESAVSYWKNRAEREEKEHAYYEEAWNKEHNKLLDAQDEIAKIKEHINKVCKESSDDIQELDEENKELKQELSDNKNHIEVLFGRIEKLELDKHSAEQVANVFLADLDKKDAEINELRERNAALKRQLDESNKQIEIYAKKVRNLEAELEEDGGFNDERNFI